MCGFCFLFCWVYPHLGDPCGMLPVITTVTSVRAFSGLACSDSSKGCLWTQVWQDPRLLASRWHICHQAKPRLNCVLLMRSCHRGTVTPPLRPLLDYLTYPHSSDAQDTTAACNISNTIVRNPMTLIASGPSQNHFKHLTVQPCVKWPWGRKTIDDM